MASIKHTIQPTNDLMMTNTESQTQTREVSPIPALGSSSHQSNNGYEDLQESLMENHHYEDLKLNTSAYEGNNENEMKPHLAELTSRPLQATIEGPNRTIEESTRLSHGSSISLLHIRNSCSKVLFCGIALVLAITALVLVVLLVTGVIRPKCDCDRKLETIQQHLTRIEQTYVPKFLLYQKLNGLGRNVSLLDESSTNNFKRNITTEVRQLREKQIQIDSSLNNLKEKDAELDTSLQRAKSVEAFLNSSMNQMKSSLNNLKENDKTQSTDIQEISAKVIGLAVAVTFLGTNDSLIKSKVHDLSVSEVKFKSSLESLKQKDAELDTSLQRAKSVEAFLNSSMNQLKSVDGQLEMKVDLLNTTFMRKINNISGMISAMQGSPGPPGPPGPSGIPGKPGAGNLSQCYHEQQKHEGASNSAVAYFVNFVVPKNKVLVGATCSTIRGDETNLSSVTNSRGEKVYSCQCKGQSNVHNDSGDMKCFIDVWVCPRTS